MPAHEWSLLSGLVTGVEALVPGMPAFLSATRVHLCSAWMHFAAVAAGIAIFCSIIGNGLWNHASRALPLALMGQMIEFETIFAAPHGFLWEQRWPTLSESAAMGLLIAGVASCACVHRAGEA
jgi:drug/metabolite transporter (DMT)-like permease